jgi:hypothetical protein
LSSALNSNEALCGIRVEFDISPACPVWEQSRKWQSFGLGTAQARLCRPDAPRLRQNNPTGKIPLNLSGKSALPVRPVLSRQEGRIAIVTNAGGDAVDAAASARSGVAGRVSRERSTGVQTNGAIARRSLSAMTGGCVRQKRVVLAPVAGVKSVENLQAQPCLQNRQFADDGDKSNSSPGRARHKP